MNDQNGSPDIAARGRNHSSYYLECPHSFCRKKYKSDQLEVGHRVNCAGVSSNQRHQFIVDQGDNGRMRLRVLTEAEERSARKTRRDTGKRKIEPLLDVDDGDTLPVGGKPPEKILLSPGDMIDERYQVQKKLGEGGASVVFRAEDLEASLSSRQTVVLKFHLGTKEKNEYQDRAWRSVAVLEKLKHPRIPFLYDAFFHPDYGVVTVEECVQGDSLEKVFQNDGRILPWKIAVQICCDVCDALEHAGRFGIVHRDIKPANLMVVNEADDIRGVLIDWGLSKQLKSKDGFRRKHRALQPDEEIEGDTDLTQQGDIMGTPVYMAPEQIDGGKLDERTDVYNLAATIWHLVTGRRLFLLDTLITLAEAIKSQVPQNATKIASENHRKVPQSLSEVLDRALCKAPARRYQNAAEFRAALQACLEEEPTPVGFWARLKAWRR